MAAQECWASFWGADMRMKEPEFVCDDEGIFVIVDGVKVAKRERETWISLKPEWVVRDHEGTFVGEDIGVGPVEIEYKGVRVR
jgi:hypothetical protein